MEQFLISIGVALLLLMLMSLFRVVAGPTVIDRILGVNVIGIKTVVLIIIVGILDGRVEMFIDIALAYALLNFITTIAAARFYQRQSQPAAADAEEAKTAPSAPPTAENPPAGKEGSHA
ncbi:monovalent cation/H+ antiporter complex subunit F [Desulfurivibrio dismutans]|uniref:monovalent cation/H+ antiporter complex subunit F n=1 Tax=Desulfurivibrio dismutans TaxID=1398908 RepID=UPI0023DA26ED|nr:monovalent cation/H+ antiporter complex subunit F [Desulfurivibrio alkaliphilus]MDF1614295.1 monovalent cation/H+ antiporter complex subunit F [Desulfurivibrio alkaliphilus]